MQQERYSRQLVLPGFGPEAQSALSAARVLVLGAGGLGSYVIPALAAAGVGTIGIIDDDVVELSNLHRQTIHGMADLGSAKVSSAEAAIRALNPDVAVIGISDRLTSENALVLFADYDLVIDGTDNFETRFLANDCATVVGIPMIWGSVSQYGGQAGVAWDDRGPTYRDLFPSPPPADSVLSCEVGGVLPTVCGVIGSIMATEAIKIITAIGDPLIGRVIVFDALTGRFREIPYVRAEAVAAATTESHGARPMDAPIISATELEAELSVNNGLRLIDVREPWEAELASIPGSTLIPLGTLPDALATLDRGGEIIVYCHSGARSAAALRLFEESGFSKVRHLDGGIDAWSRLVDSGVARY